MRQAAAALGPSTRTFTTGSYHEPVLKIDLLYRFVIRTGTKGSRAGTLLYRLLPLTFSPGAYNKPGLKGPVEPGLALAGALPVRTRTIA